VSIERKISQARERRKNRVRTRLGTGNGIRVSVFRSLSHIYAQIIDDNSQKTLVSCSSLELENLKGDKKFIAQEVGKELAKRALKQGLNEAAFDRGQYLYHGRVKALAQGVREGGLKI
jgi:large subunit ribosomal protein L18